MGLKSAGFSLGSRIEIISKKDGIYSKLTYVDRNIIEEEDEYVVCRDELPEEKREVLETFLKGQTKGTMVEINGCRRRNHASANATIRKLQERLGLTYFSFFIGDHPLTITIDCNGIRKQISVSPNDILYLDNALDAFDYDTYNCKLPCKVFEESFPIDKDIDPIKIVAVIFPKDKMKNHNTFSNDEKQLIKSFKINRKNNGFFIYRNGRLISLGNKLVFDGRGIIGRDQIGLRVRMDITEKHDDILHVDVSKQNLSIPEDILKKLKNIMRLPRKAADDAFILCDELLKIDEGESFNKRNEDFIEQDDDEEGPFNKEYEIRQKKRKNRLGERTKQKLTQDDEILDESDETPVETMPPFKRIRYSEKMTTSAFWDSGFQPGQGTFVRINKRHPFYTTIIANISEKSAERQAIEGLILMLAISENKTFEKLEMSEEEIDGVFRKFKRILSNNLDEWSSNNQDLFNYD